MEITAALVREKGSFVIERVEMDDPRPDEVLIKMVATGMCHTDLGVLERKTLLPLPIILGHEGAGIVEKVGENIKNLQPGDHVALSYGSCGKCDNCLDGRPYNCRNFGAYNVMTSRPDHSHIHSQGETKIGGSFFSQSSFATYAIANGNNVVKIDKDIPLELAGPLGCGLQTGAGAVFNVCKPKKGNSIVVFGTGAVGLAAIMAAKVAECSTIIAVDLVDSRLELAKELGATHTLNGKNMNILEEIHKIISTGVNFAIDTTARPETISTAVEATDYNAGMCVLLGVPKPNTQLTFPAKSLQYGRILTSSIEGNAVSQEFIPFLIRLYKEGKFSFDKLVKFYTLDQINEAAVDSMNGTTIKPIIKF